MKAKKDKEMGGVEFKKAWYDGVYSAAEQGSGEYSLAPEFCMYAGLWLTALTWFSKNTAIYDLGCGVGQFAQLALDREYNIVKAVDFSEVAIGLAKKRNQKHAHIFSVQDLNTPEPFKFEDYTAVTCFEVLEHIENDLAVLNNIIKGTQVVFSVPSYGYRSHVRHFPTFADVQKRYEAIIDMEHTLEIVMDATEGKKIWLVSGFKK